MTDAAADLAARYMRRGGVVADATTRLRLPRDDRRSELAAARLLVALGRRAAGQTIRRVLFRQDWNVGVVRRPIADALKGSDWGEVEWLPARKGDLFLADPFGIPQDDGRCLLLAEEFVGASGRGRIVAAVVDGSRYVSPPRPVLELDAHLSYPYVLPTDGPECHFAPESSRAGEVGLYRLESGSGAARRSGTLLAGFEAVDPTIIEWEGRWWLFATDASRDEDSHLHVWHGASAHGPWTPHARNPVKCDVRSARPGGTPFVEDGTLYRPAQDDGRAYGGAVVINRVDVLTPTSFSETMVARLEPDPKGPYPDGIHTLSAAGTLTLLDGKRYRFAPLDKLRRRVRSSWTQLRD